MKSEINFLALGGQDENANDLFVLEFKEDIYIIDSGIEQPIVNNYGIKYYIPRIDYLLSRKNKIKGIFLSSSIFSKIGSLEHLVHHLPNVNIYGSSITLESLSIYFGAKTRQWNTIPLKSKQTIIVENVAVTPFNLSSSTPGTFGYQFKYRDLNTIYMSNYVFDSSLEFNIPIYSTFLNTKEKTFLMLTDAINANKNPNTNYLITDSIESKIKAFVNKRVFAVVYEDNFINISELISIGRNFQRKIYFTNFKTYEFVRLLIDKKVIQKASIEYIFDVKTIAKDGIIIFSSSRSTIFQEFVGLITHGKDAYNIEISQNDLVILASPPISGNEHYYANVLSELTNIDPIILKISDEFFKEVHPTAYDLKNYLQIFKPKYLIPIKGQFKEQIHFKKVFVEQNNSSENFIISLNGEKTSFSQEKYIGTFSGGKEFGKTIIENAVDSTISEAVIQEREILGKNGVVTMGAIVSSKERKVITKPDVQLRGVVFLKNQNELLDELQAKFVELMLFYLNEDAVFDKNKVVQKTTKEITKILKQRIKKTPIVIIKVLDNNAKQQI